MLCYPAVEKLLVHRKGVFVWCVYVERGVLSSMCVHIAVSATLHKAVMGPRRLFKHRWLWQSSAAKLNRIKVFGTDSQWTENCYWRTKSRYLTEKLALFCVPLLVLDQEDDICSSLFRQHLTLNMSALVLSSCPLGTGRADWSTNKMAFTESSGPEFSLTFCSCRSQMFGSSISIEM